MGSPAAHDCSHGYCRMVDMPARALRAPAAIVTVLIAAMLAAACGSSSESASEQAEDASTGDTAAAADEATDEPEDAAESDGTDSDDPSGGEQPPASTEDTGTTGADEGGEPLFPDVVDATAEQGADGTWSFSVTLSSPYDSPQRYADAWRVLAPDGTELGVRELLHDHAAEQLFTRSLGGVEIPDDVVVVTIEGRDQISGWGGATFDLTLPR